MRLFHALYRPRSRADVLLRLERKVGPRAAPFAMLARDARRKK